MDADADVQLLKMSMRSRNPQILYGRDNAESGSDRPLGIVLMGMGVTKVDHETVTQVLGDSTIIICIIFYFKYTAQSLEIGMRTNIILDDEMD